MVSVAASPNAIAGLDPNPIPAVAGAGPDAASQANARMIDLGSQFAVFASVPPHVEYSLTPLGRSLSGRIAGIHEWAYANMPGIEAARRDFDAR